MHVAELQWKLMVRWAVMYKDKETLRIGTDVGMASET